MSPRYSGGYGQVSQGAWHHRIERAKLSRVLDMCILDEVIRERFQRRIVLVWDYSRSETKHAEIDDTEQYVGQGRNVTAGEEAQGA